jgi:DNA (cytosine-5)-methyltransferase 1
MRPRLLDLFCGAGGAAVGYSRAGFEVVGVDIEPQPNYPFEFIRGDALAPFVQHLIDRSFDTFDAIHASPPCQAYAGLAAKDGRHPDLIPPVRDLLRNTGLPWVIENIVGAPLLQPVQLCGSMFGLHVRRHRLFETTFSVMTPSCQHNGQEIRAYYGKPGWLAWKPGGAQVQAKGRKPLLRGSVEQAPEDMGIDWMTWDELREAIPPAYTEYLGRYLLEEVNRIKKGVSVA